MRVLVLTTSYPRSSDDIAGSFVRDQVTALLDAGVEVQVVSPAQFRHYGIAHGAGIPDNLRRQPWRIVLLPLLLSRSLERRGVPVRGRPRACALASVAPSRARRREARCRSALGHGRGARTRVPPIARPLLRRARAAVAPSRSRRRCAELGARDVRVIPAGVAIPEHVGDPDRPATCPLRWAPVSGEGVQEFSPRPRGLPLVVVGDGPLRNVLPRPSASCRLSRSAPTTSGPPSSRAPRAGRASASPPTRRWPTAGRSWPPVSAAWPMRSRTA